LNMAETELLPISLIVIARDEAAAIGRCLDSVPFAAEKLVIDSGSTDGTPQIAARHGARVVHQPWLGFGAQRNFGARQARHDWILFLDADETLSAELVEELRAELPALMQSSDAGAFVRRETWLMGKPMRWYRPMAREVIARIYHRERAQWTEVRVHESLRFNGPARKFKGRVIHLHNPTLVHWQLKILLYAELKTRDWQDRGRAPALWLAPFVFVATFVKDYFLRYAFLDGWRGYIVAQVAASYAVYKRMRHYEMTSNPESRESAAALLKKHGLEK
jgi:glycosyltransferase involved in cell wall biosynthesis